MSPRRVPARGANAAEGPLATPGLPAYTRAEGAMALPRGVAEEGAMATTILTGRVSAIDRESRTITIGPRTLTIPPKLPMEQIDVGTSAAIVYEQREHVLVAVEVLQLSFLSRS
jgi:hypothetical protein